MVSTCIQRRMCHSLLSPRGSSRIPCLRLPILAWVSSWLLRPWTWLFLPCLALETALRRRLAFACPLYLWRICNSILHALMLCRLCLPHVSTWVLNSDRWFGLLLVWCIEEGRYAIPALVGLRCEKLHATLARNIEFLLFYRWRPKARVTEPLMPLC